VTDEIQEPVEETVIPPVSPGKVLAAARMEKGLSVMDVARSLRLSARQIEAIESEEFEKLPGMTFIRGFIRNYAKLLHLDPEPLLAVCQPTTPQSVQIQAISVPPGQAEFSSSRSQRTFSSNNEKSRVLKMLPVVLGVAALLAWGVFELIQGGSNHTVVVKPAGDGSAVPLSLPPANVPAQVEAPAPASEAPQPGAAAVSAKEPTSPPKEAPVAQAVQPAPPSADVAGSGSGKVRLAFSGESWVEIRDKAGRTIYKQTGYAGNEQIISGTPPFALTVGRASNVKVYYNDKQFELAPTPSSGDVARLTLN
jgi:cytoskeleton protein RodZ